MKLKLDVVAGGETDEVEPMLPRGPGDAPMAIRQLDAIGAVLEDLDHGSPCVKLVGMGHGPKGKRKKGKDKRGKCTSGAVSVSTFNFYLFAMAFSLRVVRISGPSSVIRTVCSK